MLAFGKFGTAKRSINRRVRWRRGATAGHDLAREPGFSLQIKEITRWPSLSYSADSPTAAPTSMNVKMNEIEIKTAETR